MEPPRPNPGAASDLPELTAATATAAWSTLRRFMRESVRPAARTRAVPGGPRPADVRSPRRAPKEVLHAPAARSLRRAPRSRSGPRPDGQGRLQRPPDLPDAHARLLHRGLQGGGVRPLRVPHREAPQNG